MKILRIAIVAALAVTVWSAQPAAAQTADPAAAAASVSPTPTCWVNLQGGDRRTYFGYTSSAPAAVTIPVGPLNVVSGGNVVGQPTTFQPGTHANAFYVDHRASNKVRWQVGSVFAASASAKQCAENQVPTFASVSALAFWFTIIAGGAYFVARRRRQQELGLAA